MSVGMKLVMAVSFRLPLEGDRNVAQDGPDFGDRVTSLLIIAFRDFDGDTAIQVKADREVHGCNSLPLQVEPLQAEG